MAFSGTQTKCKVCGKTVYPMEQLTADGVIYHRGCFRCSHCKGTLSLNSFASLEGVPYCKPHFEQLFKKTGSYQKSFDDAIKQDKEKPAVADSLSGGAVQKPKEEKPKQVNPLAARFGGTQEKCKVCTLTVYPLEKISVENTAYHKSCFKCVHAGCKLTTATYRALQGKLYCRHHFNQLFMIKGNYSALTENGAGAAEKAQPSAAEPTPASSTAPADESASAPADSAKATPVVVPKSPAASASAAPPSPSKPAPQQAKPEPPKPAQPPKKAEPTEDSDDSDDDSDDDSE